MLRRPTYAGSGAVWPAIRAPATARRFGIVVAEGVHEPLIDRATWDAVQRTLDGLTSAERPRGSWHWLNGRVVCVCVRRPPLLRRRRPQQRQRPGSLFPVSELLSNDLRAAQRRLPRRPAPVSAARLLEQTVSDALRSALAHVPTPERILREIERDRGADAILARQTAERELAELQRQRTRINDAIQLGVGDLPDLAKRDRLLVTAIDDGRGETGRVAAAADVAGGDDDGRGCRVMRDQRGADAGAMGGTLRGTRVVVTVDLDAPGCTPGLCAPFDAVLR